jgi:hypothetical protein
MRPHQEQVIQQRHHIKETQMTTKHTPATPLPECESVLRTKPHGIGRKMVYECPCGQATNPEQCPRTQAINAERDRRANAYPKLVEALRLCGERFAVIQKDVAPFERNVDYIKKIASEFADEARALLRSLGEDA